MISSDLMQKIESEFRNMNQFQIYLVPLLAFERMWTPFLEGLRPQYKSKLEYCARNCLDIMWDYVIEKKTLQKDIYQKNLSIINDLADESDPLIEFSTPFPLYLIDQLFSGIIDSTSSNIINVCASSTLGTLDMIYDNLLDQIGDPSAVDIHPAILSELDRIEKDIILAKLFPSNKFQVTQIKTSYQSLRLVPVII